MDTMHYVKFVRGTKEAFERLSQKDPDTLYFITDTTNQAQLLYLGNKPLINASVNGEMTLNQIQDVLITMNLNNRHILIYDSATRLWKNISIDTILDAFRQSLEIMSTTAMMGATATTDGSLGLVPAPQRGMQNMYLRGDGNWAAANDSVARTNISNLQNQIGNFEDLYTYDSDLSPSQQTKLIGAVNQLYSLSQWQTLI